MPATHKNESKIKCNWTKTLMIAVNAGNADNMARLEAPSHAVWYLSPY